jgi:hypothetical protein
MPIFHPFPALGTAAALPPFLFVTDNSLTKQLAAELSKILDP